MSDDTEKIHVLMSRVMGDIEAIGKTRRNEQQGFAFRGVDDVMNALHPILAKHGVFFTPEVVEAEYGSYTTAKGSLMRSCALRVRYHFYGPEGDSISTSAIQAEASDSGDKATSKAMAQALKYLLFQTFCIPTEEGSKNDPDASTPEPRALLNPTVQGWLDAGAPAKGILEVAVDTARDLANPEPIELIDLTPSRYDTAYLTTLKANVQARFFKPAEGTDNEGGADAVQGDTPASPAPSDDPAARVEQIAEKARAKETAKA